MTEKEKKVVGTILYLAQDKRTHIMYRDCVSWFETKMAEIGRMAEMLPHVNFKKIRKNDRDMEGVWKEEEQEPYMDVVKTEYLKTLQGMQWEIEDIIMDEKLGLQDGQKEYLRQIILDKFDKVLYADGGGLNLDEKQQEHLNKVLEEITKEKGNE